MLETLPVKPKKFLFDDVGDENISDDETNKNTPEISQLKWGSEKFDEQ